MQERYSEAFNVLKTKFGKIIELVHSFLAKSLNLSEVKTEEQMRQYEKKLYGIEFTEGMASFQ